MLIKGPTFELNEPGLKRHVASIDGSVASVTLGSSVLHHTVSGLVRGVEYNFAVSAFTEMGDGEVTSQLYTTPIATT